MSTGYVTHIDPIALHATIRDLADTGSNVIELRFDNDGRLASAVTTTRDGMPAGAVDVRIRREQPIAKLSV